MQIVGREIKVSIKSVGGLLPSINNDVEFVATENIPQYVLVTSNGKLANSAVPATRNKAIGIAILAVLNTFAGKARATGVITNPAWNFVSGDTIFLNGATISKVPVSTGYSQIIGTAINTNTIEINIHQAITI